MEKKNFLELYFEYAREVTDAPDVYHHYMALSVLGIAVGNGVYFPFGDTRIYPNIWLIMLGDSSFSRKTTSLNIGKRLLGDVRHDLIYPNEFSQERIQEILERYPSGGFFYSEFITLIGLLSRDYMAGTKGLLTDLFDCPHIYKRETKQGSIIISNPAISIVSATTKTWFLEKMKEGDLLGGFLPRFLLIVGNERDRQMAIPPMGDPYKRDILVNFLKQVISISGVAYLTPEARDAYEGWYHEMLRKNYTGILDAFIHRLNIYCLKFAMLIEICLSTKLKISIEAMNLAINHIKDILQGLWSLDFNFDKVNKNMGKIIEYLKRKGPQSRVNILRNTKLSAKDFQEAINNLREREQINSQTIRTSTKPMTLFELI